jgi:hypothetical protein
MLNWSVSRQFKESAMKRADCIRFSTVTALGLAVLQGGASAQEISIKEQLVGTWKFVMCEVMAPDGTKRPLVEGNNPAGQYIFTSDGHFSFQVAADFPHFASNSTKNTTPEENRAAVRGSFAYYGTYAVNDAEKTIAEHIERGSPSYVNETDGTRIITLLSANEMKYTNPRTMAGGSVNCAYTRAK